MGRKRDAGETLVDYYFTMLAIGRGGNIDDESIVSYIINGINDNDSTRALMATNCSTCNDLFLSLQKLFKAPSVPVRGNQNHLLQHDIIKSSDSPHAASVVLVEKANGEPRMCVDYRVLNSVTVKKQFPMPIVDEQLAKLSGNRFFTTLDMTSGYYQIPLDEDSRKFTAFMTHD